MKHYGHIIDVYETFWKNVDFFQNRRTHMKSQENQSNSMNINEMNIKWTSMENIEINVMLWDSMKSMNIKGFPGNPCEWLTN